MRIERIQPSQDFNTYKKVIKEPLKIKKSSLDSFESYLKDALNTPMELTTQEKLAIDGLILTNDEINLLKSFLE